MNFITALASASLWPKFFLNIILLTYAFRTRKRIESPVVSQMPYFFVILLFKDIILSIFVHTFLYIIFDTIVLLFFFYWLRQITGPKASDNGFVILNIVFILTCIAQQIFPGVILKTFLVHRLVLIFIAGVYSYHVFQVSIHNTENPEILMTSRKTITFGYIFYLSLMLFNNDTSSFVHYIVSPFWYFIPYKVLYQYNHLLNLRNEDQIDILSSDIDALFDFMRNIGSAISERIEISKILEYIVSSAVRNTKADAGAVLLVDDFEDILRVKAVSGLFPPPYPIPKKIKMRTEYMKDYFETTPINIGQTVLGEVIKTGEPTFIRNTLHDERMAQNTKNDIQFISSIIIMPLLVSKRILGALAIIRRGRGNRFNETDFANIKSFANYTSLSLDNLFTYLELLEKKEMEREVGIAAEIQQKLLPNKLPKFQNLQISAFSVPAKGVSGDYYDILKLKHGKIALVMCDVAGKGVPASLVMIMIRSIIHLIAGANKDAATIVTWINKGVTGKIDIDHFATLSFLTFDTATRTIEYSNAGHHPLMIFRNKTKKIETLDTDGLPIGIESTAVFDKKTTILEKDDLICLYTDGIIESMNTNGEQYSYERLEAFIKENYNKNTKELSKDIKEDIKKFVGKAKQHDDQTIMVMKVV